MKNAANSPDLARVKIPKLSYTNAKKAPWINDHGSLGSTPIILPPIPPPRPSNDPSRSKHIRSLATLPEKQIMGDTSTIRNNIPVKHSKRPDHGGKSISRMKQMEFSMPIKTTKEPDMANSIRKKIEQYKKWHEEHYKGPMRHLKKTDVAVTPNASSKGELLASIFNREKPEEVEYMTRAHPSDIKQLLKPKGSLLRSETVLDMKDGPLQIKPIARPSTSSPATVPSEFRNKKHSAATWKTWRNINDSYCYSDVAKYVKDNELMDEEKEKVIQEWIDNVHEIAYPDGSSVGDFDVDPSSTVSLDFG